MSSIKILLCLGQVLSGLNTLISKRSLLGAIQLSLSCLEILSNLCLASGKCLLITQQAKLVLFFHITQANHVLIVHVGEGTICISGRVCRGNRRGPIEHGRDACALSHRAVDQAPLGHVLFRLGAGLLHQGVVLLHQSVELARNCLCRRFYLGRDGLESFGLKRRGRTRAAVADVKRICCSHCCSTCEKSRYQAAFCGRTAPAKILCQSPAPVNLTQEQGTLVNSAVLQTLQRLAPGHTVFGKFLSSAFFIAAKQFLAKR